jgi:hypothetical protein
MTIIIHDMPSAHHVKVLEIRHEIETQGYYHYNIYVDGERLASVFGKDELPSLLLPDGKVRVGG